MELPTLPDDLKRRHEDIMRRFARVRGEWQQYTDRIIPEDKVFAQEILSFLIDLVSHIVKHYDDIDIPKHQRLLAWYYLEFTYGPEQEHNYLDFDENIDGESVSEFFWHLKDDEHTMKVEELERIRKKLQAVHKML